MLNEKMFRKPMAEIIEFNSEDIILTSNLGGVVDEDIEDLDD